MAARLNDDFKSSNYSAEKGYAILSYIADENKSVSMIVLEFTKS
jgi:hypothetical protein